MSAIMDLPREITIPLGTPRVLVGDDDQDFLDASEDYFSSKHFDVTAARTVAQAAGILEENRTLEKGDFDVAAIDINYGDPIEIKGNEFVRKYQHLLGKAKVVLISGEIDWRERRKLEGEGFHVLDKSRNLLSELTIIIQEESRKRTGDIEKVIMDVAAPRIKELTGIELKPQLNSINKIAFNSLKHTLIKWLQSRKNPDKPVLAYGRHIYSANEMVREVERETDVGVRHVQMMLREYEHSLKIAENDSQQYDDATEE
jgi:CheY-like chemotaxis protein